MTNPISENNVEEGVTALFDIVYALIAELEKNGYLLPKENEKSFYLKCCWVLSWLNKSDRNDYRIRQARRAIKSALPAIKEAGI